MPGRILSTGLYGRTVVPRSDIRIVARMTKFVASAHYPRGIRTPKNPAERARGLAHVMRSPDRLAGTAQRCPSYGQCFWRVLMRSRLLLLSTQVAVALVGITSLATAQAIR